MCRQGFICMYIIIVQTYYYNNTNNKIALRQPLLSLLRFKHSIVLLFHPKWEKYIGQCKETDDICKERETSVILSYLLKLNKDVEDN